MAFVQMREIKNKSENWSDRKKTQIIGTPDIQHYKKPQKWLDNLKVQNSGK